MKNHKKINFFTLVSLVVCGSLILNAGAAIGADTQKFNQEELVSLTRPSVVRIAQKVQGEINLPPFSLDLDKLTINPGGGAAKKIKVDDYLTGSGFIVSEDGYILTNSHVISKEEIKQQYIADAATAAIMDASLWYLGSNNDLNDSAKMDDYAKKITDYLSKNGTFDLQNKVVVLDPSSKSEKIEDLIAGGFPVSVISVNDNFMQDGWDMALIKIDQHNLPALPLGDAASIKRGETIGVFGFPTAAELNGKNLLESTFSQGVVSAIKDSENKDFSIIQTDAKISDGSSGSPLLDENGEVIGMITYQTNKANGSSGDNFAFAIPIDVVQAGVKKFDVNNTNIQLAPSQYYTQFSNGLELLHQARCKKALAAFGNVKNVNDKFSTSANIQPYEKKCQDLISAGKSINNIWDEARNSLYNLSGWIWVIVVAILAISLAVAGKIFSMKKRLKKEEKEIVVLEKELKENKEQDKEETSELKKIKKELNEMKSKK